MVIHAWVLIQSSSLPLTPFVCPALCNTIVLQTSMRRWGLQSSIHGRWRDVCQTGWNACVYMCPLDSRKLENYSQSALSASPNMAEGKPRFWVKKVDFFSNTNKPERINLLSVLAFCSFVLLLLLLFERERDHKQGRGVDGEADSPLSR